ncbi:uncharacterized protein LOC117117894 [Anneissia japonica]|uniref:uncharacterized protein LOC117117894 n=1 Tax=Anneissia japonica TaxID=1529436 RepID=UPI00142592C6|nr:uncharacterized protein LOC117117894 [Anneissia japonica]
MEETSAAESSSSKSDIRLSDCICPICMSILLEPVTMPCAHELCRPCFRDTVEQVNFTCPLCRLRISNWARKQTRVNKLINWTRWKEIQTAFPDLCRKRLEGEDDTDVLQPVNPIRICQPGEVRKEYEQQMRALQKQREEEEKIEKDKSQRVIKEIQEEELQQYEERRQEEERLMALDEQLARKLAGSAEPQLHVIGNLADEQARLDEQLARSLQEDQDPPGISNQTQRDEEFARRLQEELEKTSINSKISSKCSTPRSKNTTKIPAANIERFFTKMQPGESSQNLSCNSSGSSSKDDVLPSFATFDKGLSHSMNVHIRSSPENSCSRSSMDSNSETPTFLGPSTSKVIGKADVSLICMEDYKDEPIEFDENSNTEKSFNDDNMVESGNEEEKSDLCLMEPSFSATQFDECSLLRTKDLTPSPITVLKLSPPTDVEDDETRSNQEEVVLKTGGAFSPILKTPPTGVKRINAFRSDSVGSTDSISHELSHFRPIAISPRTAARKLADGKPASPALIHSTPTNLRKALETGESDVLQKSPLLMAKWLSLAQEREKKVLVGSKCVMAGKSVIQEQDQKKSFVSKPSHLNSNKLMLYSKNDAGNIADKNSLRMCQRPINVNSTDKVETQGSGDISKKQSPNWLSRESPVAATTATGNIDNTFDNHKTECISVQTADTVKRSPGKVYHMKDRTPSHSRRKNLTKILTSSFEDTNVSTSKCPSKEARIDKSILSKIVKQKEDKHRKMEEVKTDDTNFNKYMNPLDGKEIIADEKYIDLKKEQDSELKCNHEIRCNDEIKCCNLSKGNDSIKDKNGCSQYEQQLDEKVGNNYKKHKDQTHGAHSEEKSIKKKNKTAENQGRKQQNYKNCRTIEDMFAKFQKQLGTDDFKSGENDVHSVKTSSVANSSERKIDEEFSDNERIPRFTKSPKSPVQDHQILILNQTLSFKQKTDSGKLTDITKPSIHQRVGNKRKSEETPDGKNKFKFRQVSYSSPRKAQRLGFSASPKKAKSKCSKGNTHTRNDSEPLSPGTLKHNRFLKLQTKEERRLEQEELDRQVALKLQRQLDREIKAELNNVSRARGSESEYQLRSRKPAYKTVL